MGRLHTTTGMVLTTQKYGETSVIARIFTADFGLQGYFIPSVRTARARHKAALLQPLTVLSMVVYHKPQGGLQRINELKCLQPSLVGMGMGTVHKSSVALFISEILAKVLCEGAPQPELFCWALTHLQELQGPVSSLPQFVLRFLLQLAQGLGVGVTSGTALATALQPTASRRTLSLQEQQLVDALLRGDAQLDLSTTHYRVLLEALLHLLQHHAGLRTPIQSLAVLQTVYADSNSELP